MQDQCKLLLHYIAFSLALMVQFDRITYAVSEGEQVSIVAVLNFASSRDMVVEFATSDVSAIGK